MSKIISVGMDNNYLLKVFEDERLSSRLSCYIAARPIPDISPISQCERIDPTNFYHVENVKKAIVTGNAIEDIPLDPKILAAMLECEHYFMKTMDRLTVIPDSQNSKKELFIELLSFFNSYIIVNPDIRYVFFRSTPHFGWDIILYFVARHHGLQTLIMNRTDINHQFIIRHDWRNSIELENGLAEFKDKSVVEVDDVRNSDSEFTSYSKAIISKHSTNINSIGWQTPIYTIYNWTRLIARIALQKNITNSDSALFRTRHLNKAKLLSLYIKRYIVNKRTLSAYRRQINCEPDLSKKYLYFALHFQPERSTQPEGGFFDDQYLAVSILSKVIPSDWIIYVKEHPRQFDVWPPDLRKMHARSEFFYEKLANLDNVNLIDSGFDSEELIEHAQLTATITGTSSWQALKMSKPSIVFANTWYSPCESCGVVENMDGASQLVKKLMTKTQVQVEADVSRFISVLAPHLVRCYPGPHISSLNSEDTTFQAMISSLVEAIVTIVEGKRGTL